jgi:hypothetical protein
LIDLEASQLVIGQRVTWIVPSPEAQIDSADESHHVVYYHQLLVVSPEKLILPELIR